MITGLPLVSIIINNYNYGRFLRDAIDSALSQNLLATEVIVVDDGSTDDSCGIIDSYGNEIIPVYKTNGGQGSAYNAGFKVARGKYICFLDSDDTLFPQAMSQVIERFESDKIVKLQWPAAITDESGCLTGKLSTRISPPDGDLRERVIKEGPLYDFEYHTGSCYDRRFIEDVFPVPEPSYRNGADVYLIATAPVYGDILTVSEPLSTYRQHATNNYSGKELNPDRIRNYIQRFETNCNALRKALEAKGERIDTQRWYENNFNYLWPTRLLSALDDIARLVPTGSNYILVNGDEWGMSEPVVERHALQFIESDGHYCGPPADDEEATINFEQLRRAAKPTHLLIWWTCFWWFNQYPKFFRHLSVNCNRVLDNERVVVFDLREQTHMTVFKEGK